MIRWSALWSLMRDAWPTWLALAGLAVAWLLAYGVARVATFTLGAQVRYAGTLLQIFGLATIAFGLSQIRQLFGRPSFFANVKSWFKRLGTLFGPARPVSIHGLASAGATLTAGSLRVITNAPAGATMDQRMAIVEETLKRIYAELDETNSRVQSQLNSATTAIQQETVERSSADDTLNKRIEEFAVGGLHLETVGLVWLLTGVLGTSIPDELAQLLGFL